MENEIIDNIDFQQEKQEELIHEIMKQSKDCCVICGKPLSVYQYVYCRSDGTLACELCQIDEILTDCITYEEILLADRDKKSTEEIF